MRKGQEVSGFRPRGSGVEWMIILISLPLSYPYQRKQDSLTMMHQCLAEHGKFTQYFILTSRASELTQQHVFSRNPQHFLFGTRRVSRFCTPRPIADHKCSSSHTGTRWTGSRGARYRSEEHPLTIVCFRLLHHYPSTQRMASREKEAGDAYSRTLAS